MKFCRFFQLVLIIMIFLPSVSYAACSNNEDGVAGESGEIEFFTPENVLRYCDDTNWIDMVDTSAYFAKAVEFDGTNDYLSAGQITTVAERTITFSIWFRRNDFSDTRAVFSSNNTDMSLLSFDNGGMIVDFKASGPGDALKFTLPAGTIDDLGWHHILVSANLNGADVNNVKTYVNDNLVTQTIMALIDTPMEFDSNNFYIGDDDLSQTWNGDIADFWMDFGTYIDLSVEANRRKFIDLHKRPVNLGVNGQLPTGSSPDIFLSGDVATWHTNKGTGGGFAENGALTDAGYIGGPSSLTNGLVGHWKLDETSGTTAVDSSGSGNNATVTNLTSTAGIIDNSFRFSGSDGRRVYIPTQVLTSPRGSVSIWVKPSTLNTGAQADNKARIFYMPDINNRIYIYQKWRNLFTRLGTQGENDTGFDFSLNEWAHIVITYDSGSYNVYANGELVDSGAYAGLSNTCSGHMVGYESQCDGVSLRKNYFQGDIDDVRLYNRALTPSEIQILAACSGPGSYYYNFPDDVMQWCNDVVSPINMHAPAGGAGGCTTPVTSEGALNYDTDRYKACDGNGWLDVGK